MSEPNNIDRGQDPLGTHDRVEFQWLQDENDLAFLFHLDQRRNREVQILLRDLGLEKQIAQIGLVKNAVMLISTADSYDR